MKIPSNAIIPADKVTKYLLQPRPWDDKSKFLSQAGFTLDHPDDLITAIRKMMAAFEAVADGSNEYGDFYRVEGEIVGATGVPLSIVVIWLQWKLDGTFHFVTLKPKKV